MTQQPYAQPYAPQQYPQQVPQPYAQPAPVQQPYPQQPYAPQPYPQQPQQPALPLATGSLDDYYNQPSSGGGPAIGWSVNGMPKPEGTTYAGVVARDVSNADIQQQTDPKTNQPKFYRDGRPQFVMKIPLKLQPTQEFPDGEAVLFVRGQMRDELVRAMTEAGAGRDPRGGDVLQVTLVQRKPSRGGGNPQNIFAIRYQAANPQPAAPAGTVSEAPSPAPEPVATPTPAPAQSQPQLAAPVQQPTFPPQVQQAPVQPQVPAQQVAHQPQQGAPQPPSGLDAEQAALIAQLTGQPAPAPAAQGA